MLRALLIPVLLVSAVSPVVEPISVWETGGLSESTLEAVGVAAEWNGASLGVVHTGTMRLMGVTRRGEDVQRPDPGFGYPMAVAAFAPDGAMEQVVGSEVTGVLASGAVVMSERSAALRGALPGDTLEIESWDGEIVELTIGALAPDSSILWSELVFSLEVAELLALDRPAGAFMTGASDNGLLAFTLRTIISPEAPVRVYVPGEERDTRDSPLPTVIVKERFGEFAFRPTGRGDQIEIDREWVDANIVTVDVPVVGQFRCHRAVVPYIRSAIADIQAQRIDWLIDTADFQRAGGCYNPRLMRGGDKGFALSRHAWGIAIDINPSTNGYGEPVLLPDRVGEIFRSWGFAWGAGWTVKDGMHFEWARIPGEISGHECSEYQLVRRDELWNVTPRSEACP